ncbi:hypothetical protein HanHA300_Chr02g0054441 [Helianthus annuus]|nr:hypothetical protein HanHA300_Chr02g0054441 [Helianthus annuus]KAJ0618820.1 hypothetical protein HanHA89_Chr02g0057921 [Helianthus annuus]KAJ0777276.1 hypothetical protein HanLR1_Chr02g0055531 [Helianthus annuus]
MLRALTVDESNFNVVEPFQHCSHPITARERHRAVGDKVFVVEAQRLRLDHFESTEEGGVFEP